jgi:hypothetical protein
MRHDPLVVVDCSGDVGRVWRGGVGSDMCGSRAGRRRNGTDGEGQAKRRCLRENDKGVVVDVSVGTHLYSRRIYGG